MKKTLLILFSLSLFITTWAQNKIAQDNSAAEFPIRGFCIGAPQTDQVGSFVKFINEELAPRQINTLILRIDFNYQYESHPELRDSVALSKSDVKKILDACKKNKIDVVPQINLLGHQSWASRTNSLLRVYPQFDETPWVTMPEKYSWPNEDGLYCKSYCPLHPDVLLRKMIADLANFIGKKLGFIMARAARAFLLSEIKHLVHSRMKA